MAVRRVSTSLDIETLESARQAATRRGMSLSAWLAYVAGEAARFEQARIMLEEYMAEFGEPDPELERRMNAALDAAGVDEPETPEHARARARALARLDRISEET